MATQQVSAGLTAPRIFQQKSVKGNKALQSFGPLHRSASRPNNFAYNPALDSSEVTAPFKFVRPDCPPDVAESNVNEKAQQSSGRQNAAKQVKNTARSALEQVKHMRLFVLLFPSWFMLLLCHSHGLQVSFFTNNKLQEEKRSSGRFGIFGF